MPAYLPACQLVQDARKHGIEVRPLDVTVSGWDCTLEAAASSSLPSGYPGIRPNQPAVRLGLRLVSGFSESAAQRIAEARSQAPFKNAEDLALRAQLGTLEMNALAAADALLTLAGHRRQQVWEAAAIKPAPQLLKASVW